MCVSPKFSVFFFELPAQIWSPTHHHHHRHRHRRRRHYHHHHLPLQIFTPVAAPPSATLQGATKKGSDWTRLLLDRARDLIIHGSAHRGANGVAMPTDEDDQDGHFFYNNPERGAYSAA